LGCGRGCEKEGGPGRAGGSPLGGGTCDPQGPFPLFPCSIHAGQMDKADPSSRPGQLLRQASSLLWTLQLSPTHAPLVRHTRVHPAGRSSWERGARTTRTAHPLRRHPRTPRGRPCSGEEGRHWTPCLGRPCPQTHQGPQQQGSQQPSPSSPSSPYSSPPWSPSRLHRWAGSHARGEQCPQTLPSNPTHPPLHLLPYSSPMAAGAGAGTHHIGEGGSITRRRGLAAHHRALARVQAPMCKKALGQSVVDGAGPPAAAQTRSQAPEAKTFH
jgi:hypothetical protein